MTERDDITIRPVGVPGDLGWVVMAHGELYAAEYGWDASFEALVAQIVADYARAHDPTREAGWIAEAPAAAGSAGAAGVGAGGAEEAGARRLGCVFCVRDPQDETAALLRILLVHPDGRGHGVGGVLVDACLAFARAAGYARIRLWTNDVLAAARHVYVVRGFVLTGEEPHHSFGADLVGQTYELALR